MTELAAAKTSSQANVVRFALGITMILLALTLFAAIQNPVTAAPQIVFLMFVVVGLWKKRPWTGYGTALVIAASIGTAILAFSRGSMGRTQLIGMVVGFGLLAAMYWLAGRHLGPVRPLRAGAVWIAVAGFVLLFPIVLQPFSVPTGGMEATILQGDFLLVPRLRPPGAATKRGEIVVFHYPVDRRQVFIKRAVAVGGDRVRMANKKLLVNGAEVNEPFALHNTTYLDPGRDTFPVATEYPLPSKEWARFVSEHAGQAVEVPKGKLFVLGDNRDVSLDSRFWGFVDESDVIGIPLVIYWSEDRRRLRGEPETLMGKVRWDRVFRLAK